MVQGVPRRTALAVAVLLGATASGVTAAPAEAAATPTFPIRRYGARSDGITDDTAAISRASEAASRVRGTVVLPVGTTVWNGGGAWYPHVTYTGAGAGATVLVTAGSNSGPKVSAAGVGFRGLVFTRGDDSSPFLRLQAPDCWIRGCTFQDHASPKSTAVNVDAGARRAVVAGNVFRNVRSTSLYLDGCSDVLVERNTIVGQRYETGYWAAVQMGGPTRRTTIRRNTIRIHSRERTSMNGIGLSGTGNLIERNTIRSSRFAIEAGDGVRGTIRGNRCGISSTPVRDGLNYAGGISLPRTHDVRVLDNVIDQRAATRPTWVGIELPESVGCVVTGNTLRGSRFGSQGVILDSARHCTVADNDVSGYPGGITLYGHAGAASDNRVIGNRIAFRSRSADVAGVSVLLDATGSADRNLIERNRITGAGGGRGVSLDRQVGVGSLSGNRVVANRVSKVAVRVARIGDRATRIR